MAGLLYAGFDYGATANLPGLWDAVSDVAIDLTAGRGGGGAAAFDAALASSLSATLTWTGTAAERALAYMGLAFKPTSELGAAGVTLAQIVTSDSVLALVASPGGSFTITQDGVSCCEAGPGFFARDSGCYVEWSVQLAAATIQLRVRVNGFTVGTGALASLAVGEAFVSVALGGVVGEGTWLIDDVYVLSGKPVNPISLGSRVVRNAEFLGNVRVQGLLPTGDGYHIASDAGYTPWVPSAGLVHYLMVNDNPPDAGGTNESTTVLGAYSGGMLDAYDTFQVTHPDQGVNGFGLMPLGLTPWPLFAVQTILAMNADAARTANATIRVVDDLPSTDLIELSPALAVSSAAYLYFGHIFDRDPSL